MYDTSRLAARAYNVVQAYLRKYRNECKVTKDTPKDELTAVFADARKAADEAVQRLRREINMNLGNYDRERDETAVDIVNIQSSPGSSGTENAGTRLAEATPETVSTVDPKSQPTLTPETVSTVDSKSQPSDSVEQDIASDDPATSASEVDSSTP